MSVIITNREPESETPLYTVEIAGQVIAEFRHRRDNGLPFLLETAAKACAAREMGVAWNERPKP